MATLQECQIAYDNRAPDDDAEDCTSLQPLGEIKVLVVFEPNPIPFVRGALIEGGFVHSWAFAAEVVDGWTRAIQRERESDERDAFDAARDA